MRLLLRNNNVRYQNLYNFYKTDSLAQKGSKATPIAVFVKSNNSFRR